VRIGPRDGRGRVNGGREWCAVVVVVPKSGASETLGVRGAEGKGNERAERWWVGEGNVRDKGTGCPAEARWLDDGAFGRE
jgi:hypothetical protein